MDKEIKEGKGLTGLHQIWSQRRWVTKGRLGKGMFKILGVKELPILLPNSRLAELVMMEAQNEDHKKDVSKVSGQEGSAGGADIMG